MLNKWIIFGLGMLGGFIVVRIKNIIETNILYEHLKQMIENDELDINIDVFEGKDKEDEE